MQTDEVIKACIALTNAGKKPTIALVKTKLTNKYPLALIVKGINQFQTSLGNDQVDQIKLDKTDPIIESKTNDDNKCACSTRIEYLEKEMLRMAADIINLREQVKALIE